MVCMHDVCEVLELPTPARVAETLEEDEVSLTHIPDSSGRQQETTNNNESGLYNVILRSDKPEAKSFKRWITHKAIPSIREADTHSMQPLEQRARVNLDCRLSNLRNRMFEQGARKTAMDKANKLDVIEQDPKLREIYSKIIQEYVILKGLNINAVTDAGKVGEEHARRCISNGQGYF